MFYDIIRRKLFVLDSLAAPVGNNSRETLPLQHRPPMHSMTKKQPHLTAYLVTYFQSFVSFYY